MLVRQVDMTGPSFLKQRVGLAESEVAALTGAQGCLIGMVMGFIRPQGHEKICQIGRTITPNDVKIGVKTTVNRGHSRDGMIGEASKIDKLVQIGHNVGVRAALPVSARWDRMSGGPEVGIS